MLSARGVKRRIGDDMGTMEIEGVYMLFWPRARKGGLGSTCSSPWLPCADVVGLIGYCQVTQVCLLFGAKKLSR